jgi:cytochrome c553
MPGFRNNIFGALLMAAFFMASLARADGDASSGAVLADTCMGCHGIAGYRNAYPSYRVPKLGGQHDEYMVLALQGYKNKTRAHPTMQAQAATMTEQDMHDLTAYFAAQGEPRQGSSTGGSARGKEKAAVCTACHGATGLSPTGNWPNLAGQHKDYLEHAIRQYQSGARKDPVMSGLVTTLSDEDIADIAGYYAAQPGLFTADGDN